MRISREGMRSRLWDSRQTFLIAQDIDNVFFADKD